ncbi:MAG: hypothetical protein IH946_08290 [Bacteroidetes bacterium]|nr:hypothetical protein [Bacteroidota bacterium]
MNENFIFTAKQKRLTFILMGVGFLALLLGAFMVEHIERLWATILFNTVFFLGIALLGLFFISASTLANAGWFVLIRRIPEAMINFIPMMLPVMLVIFFVGGHSIYHWTLEEVQATDKIIAGKMPYLNTGFFVFRMVLYFVLWFGLGYLIRKASQAEDIEGGTSNFKKGGILSALFILVFGVTSSTSSWDWIMSIDVHWYSTLFGWYNFASLFVTGMAVLTLFTIFLKRNGYLEQVNAEHLHDLGKFMFAFSIFWTYLWFSQFMLIWYANIPEETGYYVTRFEEFGFLFFSFTI